MDIWIQSEFVALNERNLVCIKLSHAEYSTKTDAQYQKGALFFSITLLLLVLDGAGVVCFWVLSHMHVRYYLTNHLNEKSDVYSFGVLLLELISGLQPIIVEPSGEKVRVVNWLGMLSKVIISLSVWRHFTVFIYNVSLLLEIHQRGIFRRVGGSATS